MHEIQINLLSKTFIYNFNNNNAYTTNWENIKTQAFELAPKNDINIWMDKFPNVDIGFSSQNIALVEINQNVTTPLMITCDL
jgi:hypothetical protein